jgi:5-methylcytosine-specific restriction endonuclease McrA
MRTCRNACLRAADGRRASQTRCDLSKVNQPQSFIHAPSQDVEKGRAYIPLMEETRPLQSIPDDELLHRLTELMGQSRRAEADIVAHIAEVEERRLFAREAFPSMFAYCLDVLHLSEAEAYLRIAAARASLKHPILLTMLADGRLHLTAIVLLAPHLTRENRDGLLERATHRSKRQIEELIAEIAPRPDAPVMVRKLPERRTLPTPGLLVVLNSGDGLGQGLGQVPMLELGPDGVGVLRPDGVGVPETNAGQDPPVSLSVVQPLSPGRYKVQFTASAEFHHKLERLQALMGSNGLEGDLAAVIEQAVTEKLERLEARRFARTNPRKVSGRPRPSPSSRHIPAPVRRAVYERDGGRCRYVDEQGRRCKERDQLQFHHRHPYGLGGEHSVQNIRLMCRAHNDYLARCDYGWKAMANHRRPRDRASHAPSG